MKNKYYLEKRKYLNNKILLSKQNIRGRRGGSMSPQLIPEQITLTPMPPPFIPEQITPTPMPPPQTMQNLNPTSDLPPINKVKPLIDVDINDKEYIERVLIKFEKKITFLLETFHKYPKLDYADFENMFYEIQDKLPFYTINDLSNLGRISEIKLKLISKYFTTLYDDLCFASPLKYNKDYNFETGEGNIFNGIEENFKEKCKDKKYMFFKISLPGHSNLAFVDLQNKTIEYFEPNDDFEEEYVIHNENGDIYSREILVEEIKKILYTELEEKFIYQKINYYKYFTGNFQSYDSTGLEEKSTLEPEGYCSVWIFYYLDTRMKNPNLSQSEIILKYNLNKYQDKEVTFDNGAFRPKSLMDIRIYALFIEFSHELFKYISKMYGDDILEKAYDSFGLKIKELKKSNNPNLNYNYLDKYPNIIEEFYKENPKDFSMSPIQSQDNTDNDFSYSYDHYSVFPITMTTKNGEQIINPKDFEK